MEWCLDSAVVESMGAHEATSRKPEEGECKGAVKPTIIEDERMTSWMAIRLQRLHANSVDLPEYVYAHDGCGLAHP